MEKEVAEYSYITVITNEQFIPGLDSLAYSLRKVNSQYPLCVLMPKNSSLNLRKRVSRLGLRVIFADNVEIEETLKANNIEQRWNETLFKLQVFGLVEYKKLVYIDSDMIVLKNIDELFQHNHMSCVPAGICAHADWQHLNSGLMVIEPNIKTYEAILSCILDACNFRIEQGLGFGDQDVIKFFYSDWYMHKDLVLSEHYNVLSFCVDDFCKTRKFSEIRVLHFAETKKIWQYSPLDMLRYVHGCFANKEYYHAKVVVIFYIYYLVGKKYKKVENV